MVVRVSGLLVAAGLAGLAWIVVTEYASIANVARWTGLPELRWLRAWLIEFRMPVLCILGAFGFSAASALWSRTGLGS